MIVSVVWTELAELRELFSYFLGISYNAKNTDMWKKAAYQD